MQYRCSSIQYYPTELGVTVPYSTIAIMESSSTQSGEAYLFCHLKSYTYKVMGWLEILMALE